ncbi:MAG: GvpL/GvpF family gas vesicle protein [Desulfitobacteriaceae bacterium]
MFFAYGIMRSEPLEVSWLTVGEDKGTLCCIVEGDLAMVCGEMKEDSSATMESTRQYTGTLCHIIKYATIIPVRFGTMFNEEEEIRKVLRQKEGYYSKLLSQFDNTIEVEVKVWWKEEDFAQTMLKNKRLSRWKKALEGGKGQGYDVVEFGQEVQAVAEEERKKLEKSFLTLLRPLAADYVTKEAADSYQAFDGVFLVKRNREEDFDTAVGTLYDKHSANMILKYTGPWAPHHFVSE